MPDTITTEFLALRDRYIASCFTKLNPVQQQAVFTTEGAADPGRCRLRQNHRSGQPHCQYHPFWPRLWLQRGQPPGCAE